MAKSRSSSGEGWELGKNPKKGGFSQFSFFDGGGRLAKDAWGDPSFALGA